jgi:putative inorganic carbon (HCO3(-)) transporter
MRQRNITNADNTVSSFTFVIYILFVFEFFMHFSSRFTVIGVMRPTVIFVVLLTLLLISQRSKFKAQEKSEIFVAMNALIIYLIISLPVVEYPGSVLRVNLVVFVKAIVFFYFTALVVDTDKRLVTTLKVFVGTQVFRVLEPLFLHLTTGYWGDRTYSGGGEFAGRLGGAPADVINANELGFVIVTVIPFLHYLLLPKGFLGKILYFSLLIPLLYTLMLTMSRGSFLALLVIGWMIFKESKRKLLIILVACSLAVAGWGQMDNFQKDRYLSLVGASEKNSKTTEGRLKGIIWEFEVGLSRPLVGHGLGTTPETKFHLVGKKQASHNMYGELLIEVGIVGFIFFIRYILAIRRGLSSIKKTMLTTNDSTCFYGRLTKSLTAIFFMYAFYSLNYWGLSQYYWYMFGGLVVVSLRLYGKSNDSIVGDK